MELEIAYKTKIIRLLTALFPTAKIILFGSRARGTHRPSSDIDIALDGGVKLPRHDINEAVALFSETSIPYKIEIVDIHAVSNEMRNNINKEGVTWKN